MNMSNKSSFFQNTECEYFPCHKIDDNKEFNCLFCYCPLYALGEDCNGNYHYTSKGVKNCRDCSFPHIKDNYKKVLSRFDDIAKLAARKDNLED